MDQQTILSIASIVTSAVAAFAAVASALISKKVYKSQTTPDVIAHVSYAPGSETTMMLYVENIGSAPAYDVSLSMPEGGAVAKWIGNDCALNPLGARYPFLPPGGVRKYLLHSMKELWEKWGDETGSLFVEYRERRNGPYVKTTYPIEVKSYKNTGYIKITTAEDTRRKNAMNSIVEMTDYMKKIAEAAENRDKA